MNPISSTPTSRGCWASPWSRAATLPCATAGSSSRPSMACARWMILRRVNDAFCDPLALRGDSLLGVPGLVEATRAGQVSVANAFGSGLVESPAFLPFLSGLATHLLGEELKLPSLATWGGGDRKSTRLN